ncbi:MAG: DUF554 domain-containing protein [Flavobacteriales bacterium TMED191]|nr:MAG: DUF554 domain-containing protein [Flavobacteriales bacterium TMED191]
MIPLGTLFNVLTVILGGSIGLFLKRYINPELNKKVFFIIGLFTVVLGLNMSLKNIDFIVMLLSIVLGTLLGEWGNFSDKISYFINKLKNKLNLRSDTFSEGIITAFFLFCVGSMTIVGAIDEGLGKSPTILYTKSIMDGISSIILASTLGVGVLFSVIPMIAFQGGITILVFYYKDFFPLLLVDYFSSVGGVIIIALGLQILGYKHINPINMLPSLFIVILIYLLRFQL